MTQIRTTLAALALLPLATACASSKPDALLGLITPYRIEVVQGNVVTKEMAERLRPGLTRDQVKLALGTPLVTDLFHADRWDYVFTIKRQGAAPQQRRLTVFFQDDKVVRFDAPDLPSELDFVASIDARPVPKRTTPLALTDEQIKELPVPVRPPAEPASAAGPDRPYPPLEPNAQ